MTSRGPLLTLAAVVAVGGLLFAVNATRVQTPGTASAAPAAAAVTTSATTPPAASANPPTTAAAAPVAPVVGEAVFAGRSADKKATVAIAVKDGHAVAYVCDGKKIEAWLDGTLSGNKLALAGRNGSSIAAAASADSAAGTIVVGTRQYAFTAAIAGKPAGLYEGRADVRGVASRIGWIVLPDGQQVGIRSVAGGSQEPAPTLDPLTLDRTVLDGAPVRVRVLVGTDTVTSG